MCKSCFSKGQVERAIHDTDTDTDINITGFRGPISLDDDLNDDELNDELDGVTDEPDADDFLNDDIEDFEDYEFDFGDEELEDEED